MRADALLSRFGYCSRREASRWFKANQMIFCGRLVRSGAQQVDVAGVLINGRPVEFPDGLYVAFYKPLGIVCSHAQDEGASIYEFLPDSWQRRKPPVTSVGRLDKETEGLLLLTDNGDFVHKLTSPSHHIQKTYELTTSEDIPQEAIKRFASGQFYLRGEPQPCLPAQLVIHSPRRASLTLTEGRYHQVRRMMSAVGAPVLSLLRRSIGDLSLEGLQLKPGEWKSVDPKLFNK